MERTSLRSLLMLGGAGGGGASNIVTGSFTGETAGAAMSVTIPYTGSGYPVAGIIYPTGGSFKPGSAIASLTQTNAVYFYAFSKNDESATPTYSGDVSENQSEILSLYKYSTSESSAKGHAVQNYNNSAARATSTNCVRLMSNTSMSVYIADTSYGFPKDIEFTYYLIYSE